MGRSFSGGPPVNETQARTALTLFATQSCPNVRTGGTASRTTPTSNCARRLVAIANSHIISSGQRPRTRTHDTVQNTTTVQHHSTQAHTLHLHARHTDRHAPNVISSRGACAHSAWHGCARMAVHACRRATQSPCTCAQLGWQIGQRRRSGTHTHRGSSPRVTTSRQQPRPRRPSHAVAPSDTRPLRASQVRRDPISSP